MWFILMPTVIAIFVILIYRVIRAHNKLEEFTIQANRELVCLAIYTAICGLSYVIKRKYAMEYFDVSLALMVLIPIHYISSLITERVNINESGVVLFFGVIIRIKLRRRSHGQDIPGHRIHHDSRRPVSLIAFYGIL